MFSNIIHSVHSIHRFHLMKKKNLGLFLRDHSHLPEHPQTMMRDSKSFMPYMFSNIIHSVHSIHRFHSWADEEKKLGALSERPFTSSRASTDKFQNHFGPICSQTSSTASTVSTDSTAGLMKKKIGVSF